MNKLPFNPTVRHHAWSDDPERDRRVRLAEDGRTEPGATLEEAIGAVFEERSAGSYRLLAVGEEVMADDETDSPASGGWTKVMSIDVGKRYAPQVHWPVRRRVTNTGGER